MVHVLGNIDYDLLKQKILEIINAKDFKVVIIDSAGNVISDIKLSDLRDALLNDIKGAYRLGVKDLTVNSDEIIDVPSGVEISFNNMDVAGRYSNYGVTRCYGTLRLKAGCRVRLGANSVLRLVK